MKTIPLTKGKFAIVDDEDFAELSKHKWFENCGGAARNKKMVNYKRPGGLIHMHREIMKTPKGFDTDHINFNRLDNRRSNLRIATRRQNNINCRRRGNKTGALPKGVYQKKGSREFPFYTGVSIKGTFKQIGYFKTITEAQNQYQKLAKKQYGKFARFD